MRYYVNIFIILLLLVEILVQSWQASSQHFDGRCDDEDEFMGNAYCDGHLKSKLERPKIPYYLSGGARTLNDPRVYKSMRKNLIEAFGGSPKVRSFEIEGCRS